MKHSPKVASMSGNDKDTFLPISTTSPPAEPTNRSRRRKANKANFPTTSNFNTPISQNSLPETPHRLATSKAQYFSRSSSSQLQQPTPNPNPGTLKVMHASQQLKRPKAEFPRPKRKIGQSESNISRKEEIFLKIEEKKGENWSSGREKRIGRRSPETSERAQEQCGEEGARHRIP